MDGALTLATQHTDGTLTIAVTGELDIATSQQLLACLDGVLTQLAHHRRAGHNGDRAVNRLVIDTSSVSFIDAHGLGVLVAMQNRARHHNIALRLVAPSAAVRQVLTITGMRYHFLPYPGAT
ncbi:STAS domain-containing protein [Actinomadura sp. 6N118]|uniref:STAS domain-containing protein n=1 Tax=Actinomadura sp. 6N118 TaxID=3375151 RepID=UPI003787B077